MDYPKPVMRMSELVRMGFPEELLMSAYKSKGQTFAGKIDPGKKNSPIIFETAGFEAWRLSRIRMENRSLMRGGGGR